MTLHWWMHWFWVTAQLAGILANPLPSTTQDPKIQRIVNETTVNLTVDSNIDRVSSIIDEGRILVNVNLDESSNRSDQNDRQRSRISSNIGGSSFRVAKAINSHDSPTKTNTALTNNNARNIDETFITELTTRKISETTTESSDRNYSSKTRASEVTKRNDRNFTFGEKMPDSIVPDSEITWVLTTSKTPERRKKKNNDNFTLKPDILRNFSGKSHQEDNKDLTVLPLRIETARFKLVVNSTRTITADGTDTFNTRTFNGSEDIEIDQELAEPRLSATATSILQDFLTAGISESTRLSRARNAFSSDFQRGQREEDRSSDIDVNQVIIEANESVNREIETSSSPSVVDIAAITGSCLATVVLLSTMASLGFVMYRRKYLNPPQTLNSDKCSNPDSSGYIDDSTIRDNSEEMYSLDNDSFLNSLEAMTIQNYWTDSVKHTKL